MKHVLVTGAAGFIGSKLASTLLEENIKVVGIDNLNTYYDTRLKEHRLQFLKQNPNFEFYKIDIESKTDLNRIFKHQKYDVVFNLAARAGVRYSMENPDVYMSTNAQGTLNILECMKASECKKLILASTSSLYAGCEMPFVESLAVNTPISPYAASKKAAEMLAYTYHYLYEMDVSVLRYFTVYGPSGRPDMSVYKFIKWIHEGKPLELYGDGTQARDFTYVDDIAIGTKLAAKNLGYQIINLGGGKNPIPITYLISEIEKNLGKKAIIQQHDFHKADVKETWADIQKAQQILGWSPSVNLEEGIQRTVKWYLDNIELNRMIQI